MGFFYPNNLSKITFLCILSSSEVPVEVVIASFQLQDNLVYKRVPFRYWLKFSNSFPLTALKSVLRPGLLTEGAFCGAGNGSQVLMQYHRNFRVLHTISRIIVYIQWVIL